MVRAEVIAGLVGGDGKKPGAKTTLGIKGLCVAMDLDEGLLKKVIGSRGVGDEAEEEREEFLLIAQNKLGDCLRITARIIGQQLFICQQIVILGTEGAR